MGRSGQEVIVKDRGRPVARITPVSGSAAIDRRRQDLLATGRITPPRAALPSDFTSRPLPAGAAGRSLAALLEERETGR